MAPTFKAVVFDLDGTLVDSVELITISFQHAIREVLGREASREEAMQHVGTPLREQMVRISPEHADELVAVYREFNHREHDRMLKLYDGILDLLNRLTERRGASWGWSRPSPGPPRRWPSTSPGSSLLRRDRLLRRGAGQQALRGAHPLLLDRTATRLRRTRPTSATAPPTSRLRTRPG